jgi:hypothetical protein
MDQTVFLRRKNVRTQFQIVAIMVNQFERQHGSPSLPRSFYELKSFPLAASTIVKDGVLRAATSLSYDGRPRCAVLKPFS